MIDFNAPTVLLVIGSSAINSLNPYSIGVLILVISVLLGGKRSIGKLFFLGTLYICSLYVTNLLVGLGLAYFLSSIPRLLIAYISISIAVSIFFVGILEVKDFFRYGKWITLQMNSTLTKKIHDYSKHVTAPGIILLGGFVAAVDLLYSGAPYAAIISTLSFNFNFSSFLLLVIYNLIFVTPLMIILLLVTTGTKISMIKDWKQENRKYMKLASGLLLITLGLLLTFIASSALSIGSL